MNTLVINCSRSLRNGLWRSAQHRSTPPSQHLNSLAGRPASHAFSTNAIMKRSITALQSSPSKRRKPTAQDQKPPAYHLTPQRRTSSGEPIWPAPASQLATARRIIQECAASGKHAVICPDKDADGLSAGVTLWLTLLLLGHPPSKLSVFLPEKFQTVQSPPSLAALAALNPGYLFVLDHGSRPSPPLLPDPQATTLVIDHHFARPTDFPERSEHVTACESPPVATSALLTYEICRPLHALVKRRCGWLAVLGTQGDLGASIAWQPPFPDVSAVFARHGKKRFSDGVSAVNAPRRHAEYRVKDAWDAMLRAAGVREGEPFDPAGEEDLDILAKDKSLQACRREVAAEAEMRAHAPPKFSFDTTVAVLRIKSTAQVHPLVATRWAAHLNSKKLDFVMCANEGYQEGKVHFSCRIAKVAKMREVRGEDGGILPDGGVNIIEALKEWAGKHESGDLIERMGESFARGHVQASGGIVKVNEFEDLMAVMRVGEKPAQDGKSPSKGKAGTIEKSPQKNTISNYFGRK